MLCQTVCARDRDRSSWNIWMRSFKIYGIWPQGCIHTHLRNAVPLVWGSLRLAPTICKHGPVQLMRPGIGWNVSCALGGFVQHLGLSFSGRCGSLIAHVCAAGAATTTICSFTQAGTHLMIFHPIMNMMNKGQGSYSHIIAYTSKQQALGHHD